MVLDFVWFGIPDDGHAVAGLLGLFDKVAGVIP